MAIQALTGLPGHGKSYSAVELFLIPAGKAGRPIVTNVPLSDKFREDFSRAEIHSIDLDKAKTDPSILASLPGGALVLLDELWRIWPAGLKAADIPSDQLSFIKEHRHRLGEDGQEMDIVFVTQDLSDIATAVRSMSEFTIVCQKLVDVGAKGRFRRDYYRGAVKGFQGPKASFIRSDHGCKYTESVWQYYRSHTKGESVSGAVDNSGVVNATIFNGLGFKIGVGAVLFLLAVMVWGFTKSSKDVGRMVKTKDVTPAVAVPGVPLSVPPAVPDIPPPPPEPVDSERWRLVGEYAEDRRTLYFVVSDGHVSKRVAPELCSRGLDTVCVVGLDRIARYTGPPIPSLAMVPAAFMNAASSTVRR